MKFPGDGADEEEMMVGTMLSFVDRKYRCTR
jgi:hypothetical protein